MRRIDEIKSDIAMLQIIPGEWTSREEALMEALVNELWATEDALGIVADDE